MIYLTIKYKGRLNMIEEIREKLCRIGEKLNRENLFELSPVYLILNCTDDYNYLQYLLNDLQFNLEEKSILDSRHHILLCFSMAYNTREAQSGFFDESGRFRPNIEQWLSYISMRYHFDNGIILIHIENLKDMENDCLWWKQFFSDIRRYKKDFLFFISCEKDDITTLQNFLEKEIFITRYELRNFTVKDYLDWMIVQLENYSVSLDEEHKTELKNLFTKYERDINHHLLELWMKSLLWNYYSSNQADLNLPLHCLSEDLLIKIIDRYKEYEKNPKIGFM